MTKFTLYIPDQLNTWLVEQARLNHRSKNKQIEYILTMAERTPFFNHESRYILDSGKTCYNGKHHFTKAEPAMADFCNCGMFMFGEIQG